MPSDASHQSLLWGSSFNETLLIPSIGEPSEPDLVASLGDRWAEVVGPAVAAHARPRNFRDGTLTIAVDAPPWATELRYLETQIRARLAAISGGDSVQHVRVVVDPPR